MLCSPASFSHCHILSENLLNSLNFNSNSAENTDTVLLSNKSSNVICVHMGNHGDFLGIQNCYKLEDVKETILKVQYVRIGNLSNSFSKEIRGNIYHQSNCELLQTVAAASLLAQLAMQVVVQTGSSGSVSVYNA